MICTGLLRSGACCVAMFQAAFCVAEASSPKRELREICSVAIDGPLSLERERRLQRVIGMGESGRDALLELAQSHEPVRMCAIDYLITLRERRVLPMLQKALADDRAESWLLARALGALGAFGTEAVTTRLVADPVGRVIERLQHGDRAVAGSAVSALGTVRDPRAVEALCKLLPGSKPRGLLFYALRAIGDLHDERSVGCVEQLAASGGLDDIERGVVASTLATVGFPNGRKAALGLLSGFKDADERARTVAELRRILDEARRNATDPSDLADIDRSLGVLKLSEVGAEK